MPTLEEINAHNRAFWAEQSLLREERLNDPLLVEVLDDELRSYVIRRVPAQHQESVERILERAKEIKKLVLASTELSIRQDALKDQARKAGKCKGSDALQQLIVALVKKGPNITTARLLEKLEAELWPESVVEAIEKGKVLFRGHSGSREFFKSAPISGLKDRLSRAKKLLRSR
jgi:hypothetical protein